MRRYVIDTNILLISIPRISPYRSIFDNLISGTFELAVSNEIMEEYLEVIAEKTTPTIANNIVDLLLSLSNVIKVDVYYKWNLIEEDKDDNKFIDACISSNSDLIVTNDSHFRILKTVPFPTITVINADEFLNLL